MSTVLLEGNIAHISLFNLLQLIKLEQKTCLMKIIIKELQQEAHVYFKAGLIKHAELNKVQGVDAVQRLICWWDKGKFSIEEINDYDIPLESINVPLESILMGSATRMDEMADLKAVLNNLESKLSFTQLAIYEIQNEMNPENPEWIPLFMTELPITFSLAKYFDVCPFTEEDANNMLKYLISTGIVMANQLDIDNQNNSAIESLASIIMEYLGFAQSQQLIMEACDALQITSDMTPGFSQLLAFSDYVIERIAESVDEETRSEIEWRLRARVTSLS